MSAIFASWQQKNIFLLFERTKRFRPLISVTEDELSLSEVQFVNIWNVRELVGKISDLCAQDKFCPCMWKSNNHKQQSLEIFFASMASQTCFSHRVRNFESMATAWTRNSFQDSVLKIATKSLWGLAIVNLR